MTPETSAPSPDSRPTRVRIAPSPTGDPHVGTAYIGLLNYLFAAQRGGEFVLRIEDTDRTRFVASSEQMIFDALKWIGLTWNEGPDVGGPYGPYRQSERTELYREHVELLLRSGHAYRSFETAEELEEVRKQQMAAKQPPRYNGAARHLSQEEIDANLAAGKPFVVRLKVPLEGSTTFRDELRGEITFDHNNVDDQVLMKSDGFPTYHLANVVDDHLMRITDVIRAEEWISSTPKHVLLYNAFGWELPKFWHMPLLRNVDKSKISKRKNPVSLVYYRESGYLPNAMLNFLGLMGGGMAQPTEQEIVSKGLNTKEGDIFSLAEMKERFDFKRISLGGPVFDLVKLKWLNGEYIRRQSPDEFFQTLRQTLFSDAYLRAVAPLVQERIETVGQFGDMTGFLFSDNVLPPESVWLPKKRQPEETLAFAAEQLTALEASTWDAASIEAELKKLGEAKQWSVKENFMLLRAILSGSLTSPPLMESLVVFGKARSLDRVRRFLEAQKKLANQRK
ncbi:glutamate--tRNA ligase [Granulicella mallensis]|uniref:Glutamate--tRNA ligase n=1 Tax=Granulicella mallensis (strain ATCC BAA-1857 / DSM 23137 / MP5ACTX8) TaxID=682795 RepID=G8P252_GRAMM|nr:glutamate--tRNA ligase [Granulicella mallensis]AEU38198.1 glutamyl-tRNA synthetase [Granulicella mallensis MP5ACTX8]